jgi:hypothetical protein
MEANLRPAATIVDAEATVSWPAIAAGAVAAAALALVVVAFGAGLGLSATSPWSDSGVSASTFRIGTGIYLIIISVMSSAVGGYLAARLRTRWTGVHNHEVFFRDIAHGFLAWAFAMLLSSSALASTTAYLAKGGPASLDSAAVQEPIRLKSMLTSCFAPMSHLPRPIRRLPMQPPKPSKRRARCLRFSGIRQHHSPKSNTS